MKNTLKKIRDFFATDRGALDWYLLGTVVALSFLGVVYSYSSQLQIYGGTVNYYNKYIKQSIYFVVGILMMFVIRKINYRRMLDHYWLLYGICLASLLYTLFNGVVVNGSKRWISLGIVNLQPSEFVKIVLVLFIAAYIEKQGRDLFTWKSMIRIGLLLALPTAFIFIQPDLGTALLFIPTVFVMFWFNGLPWRYTFFLIISVFFMFSLPLISTYSKEITPESNWLKTVTSRDYIIYLILFLIYFFISVRLITLRVNIPMLNHIAHYSLSICLGLTLGYVIDNFVLKEYQRERLVVFLDPYEYRWGAGYNVIQSEITVGSGGLWGKGLFNGNYSQLGFLPSRTTDFIFSVIAEELGFIGAGLVLFLFFFMLLRIWKMIDRISDSSGKNIIIGIFCILSFQVVINIGMTLSLLPVTGIPLPFVSAGGSTLISSLLGIGIVLSVQSKRWVNSPVDT